MRDSVNTSTLVTDRLIGGIAVLDDAIVLEANGARREIRVDGRIHISRQANGPRVFQQGRPLKNGKRYSIVPRGRWGGLLLLLPDTTQLAFQRDYLQLPKSSAPVLWRGAEVRSHGIRCVSFIGQRRGQLAQLVAVDQGANLLLVDQQARVSRLTFDGVRAKLRAATVVDCALAIGDVVRSTDKSSRNYQRVINWAYTAMGVLTKMPGATPQMQKAYEGLGRVTTLVK